MSGAMPVSGVVREAVGSVLTVLGTGGCLSGPTCVRHEVPFSPEVSNHPYPAAQGSILHPRNTRSSWPQNTNSNSSSLFLVVITCTRIVRAKLALLVMKWRNTVTNWPQLARKHKLCTDIFPCGTDFHIKLISSVSTNQLLERRVIIKVNYSRKPQNGSKLSPASKNATCRCGEIRSPPCI